MMASPARPAVISGGALTALAAALVAAFVVAPGTLAARWSGGSIDESNLRGALRDAFIGYWRAGERGFPPDLARVVDYWFRYHVVKGVIAAVLLIVLVALGVLLWRGFLRAAGVGDKVALGSGGVVVTAVGVLSLLAVMANIQGVAAPFSSLLPMLGVGEAEGELGETVDQVRQRLADSSDGRPLDVMIGDFARYHVAMAVIAAIVAVVFLGTSVLLWKRFAGTSDRRARWVFGSFGALSVLSSLAMCGVVAANTMAAVHSASALLGFFNGGW
ncbi:hypothetical protein [Nocardia sp. NPDC052566]|uniref:hypothetical protein n=1 Tax=Nocardia sp. NPDC052566 TaxID=3364330 RepID=UPI0037C7D1C9